MSTTTTPTRNGRGMPIPGIDTALSDIHQASPTTPSRADSGSHDNHRSMVFQQLAPLTPPQSAISNESRRPSLAYSSLSEAHSGHSSVCGYSQPPTPISPMHGQDLRQQWSEGADAECIQSGMQDACSHGQMPPPMFSASFSHQPTQAYSASDAFGYHPSAQSPWYSGQHSQSQQQPCYQPGLRTTLFQTSQSLGHDTIPTASMYGNPSPTIPSLEASPFTSSYDTSSAQCAPMYQPTQVVVPSQVTPHDDYPMDDFPSCASHEEVSDGFSTSFDSGTSGYGTWELVESNSSPDAYCAQSDEDDFVNIRGDVLMSPTRGTGSRAYNRHSPLGSRARRRPSRRTRKSHPEGKAWKDFESFGIRIRCEGERFDYSTTADGKPLLDFERCDSKPNKCTFEKDNGEVCGRSFKRPEHLNRHACSHSGDRPYPCPFCPFRGGRSDNTVDHFKTHLRSPTPGKRNEPCDFATLEAGILDVYDEKTSTRLLQNLRKWMADEAEKKRVAEITRMEKNRMEMQLKGRSVL